MSHPNRAASGGGGLPPTFGTPLLSGGLEPPGSKDSAPEFNAATFTDNTILSNLTSQRKLQTIQSLLRYTNAGPGGFVILYLTSHQSDAQQIYDGLDPNSKLKASVYASIPPNSKFNYGWFKELKQGLAIAPASRALLALDRGLVNLSRFSHLIVDDAHLVALEDASSPLSTIFLDHYGKIAMSERPRVLGLTHYPLELDTNFGYSALRMEQILDARILGVLDAKRAEIAEIRDRLEISVLEYEPAKGTALTLPPDFHPAFEAVTMELGIWCAPLLSSFNPESDSQSLITGKKTVKLPPPGMTSSKQTPKFKEILKYLDAASVSSHFRCIVIVRNPFTALALGWYLSVKQSRIRSSLYLDHLEIDHESGLREDWEEDFKNGLINTLICTESILSSMDGGICSHIIWFNPCGSLISFARSRLLASRGGASLVLLAERGDREHYQVARDILHMDNSISNWILNMGVDGAPIPPKSLARCPRFNGPSIIISPSCESTWRNPYIQDPISGSRIYLQDSEEALYRFLADTADEDMALIPNRIFSFEQDTTVHPKFQSNWLCRIQVDLCDLPLNMVSEPSSHKTLARSSACFRACSALFDLGVLSSCFFPPRPLHTWQHGILQPPKSKVAIDTYYPLVLPLFWHNCLLATSSSTFYPVLVRLCAEPSLGTYKDMLIMTRMPLGDIDELSVFPNQTEVKVSFGQYAPISFNAQQLWLMFQYTLNLWRVLGNKPYESPSGELAYFVVPLEPDSKLKAARPSRTNSIEQFISWQEVNKFVSFRVRPLRCGNVDELSLDLVEGIIQDRPNDFTRRFEDAKLRKDLNPLSLIMQDKPGDPKISLLEYYRTHRHEFEGIKNLQQPLIEATPLPGLANQLNPQEPLPQLSTNYLVPEMCYVSSIPASTFRTASLIPSVLWHVENGLIAKEVNLTFFQGQIRDELVMHALCSRMAHRTFSYERLEFLGDTFIKYAASAYLYGTEPSATSGPLHARRQKMVNNRSLWLGAQALGLPPCIQSEVFRPKQWFIPGTSMPKKNQTQRESSGIVDQAQLLSSRQFSRQIPPKGIADVVEALIGAALLSGGEKLAFSVAKVLGFDVPKTCDWIEVISYAPCKPRTVSMRVPDNNRETLEGVMKIIGVSLDNPELLLQAMQHPSTVRRSESYERLEFLGDSILDMLVVQSFFSDEEQWSPHNMTLLKSSMVSNRALAVICVESGLHRYLIHDINSLARTIVSFIEAVESCKQKAQTDAQRLKYWSKLVAPKVLGDVVESLLGAIYVSSGFNISQVKSVYDRLLKPFYDRYIDKKAMLTHPMSRLMKKLESIGCRAFGIAKTEMPATSGGGFKCEVKLHGRVIAEATREKPHQAITHATEQALDELETRSDRILANCTCRTGPQGKKKRKRTPLDSVEEGEVAEPLLGDDVDHPIDVDMFDF
ncbi:endoribonuclease Dicer [Rhizoctonia solani]|uniref:Endoribonuclease Dicer n=1 Tax=Rhizoctonia solani TaxID=456999 RepID=A0A0K6G5W4_9AGAM|nr:endoribonuclease Dicer [Rhizoctonia solani]